MSATTLLPMTQLHTPAHHTHILSALCSNSLLSVGTFADNGYVTIFHNGDKGATIHDCNDIIITRKYPTTLQGWQDDNGLWCIPLTKATSILYDTTVHCINNMYDLQLMTQMVCYLQHALGFPTKTTQLSAIHSDNLTTFPRLMAANFAKHFPESDETQKDHMKQIQQGM
ncbi:hypothetical protein ACHAW6_008570 [Cyclotella cf. meneghiniana]